MKFVAGLLATLFCSATLATGSSPRTLSFADRVKAQTAIERVYYSHQLGATKSFDDAMPKAVIEKRVRHYLEQTAALNVYWKTAVTDEMLQQELARMTNATRMPERLSELYAALGNDPFIIKESLARATLVDRLVRNFHAFDTHLHAEARQRGEELHRQLESGALDPTHEHANRNERELIVSEKDTAPASPRLGQPSEVQESRDAFTVDVVLSETSTHLRIASYAIPKTSWDAWWDNARHTVAAESVGTVASARLPLAKPTNALTCVPDDHWDTGSLGELPEARSEHSAVWTGSVMVVWGGYGNSGLLDTGGRYDPATDSWTSISMTGAPSGRFNHTAVWTGREMLIWGGHGETNIVFGTGGRYDPATDSWVSTTTKDAPAARSGHTAVWTGGLMVVWGGSGGNNLGLDTGGRYDPELDDWTPTSMSQAPFARYSHVAVWTGELMLVWGGRWDGGITDTGGRYDPVTDRWKATSITGIPDQLRGGYTAVWTGSLMIVWGSADYGVGARYDPATDTWTPTSETDAPSSRRYHTAVWTGTRMVIWGGEGSRGRGISTGGAYDPIADRWTRTTGVATPSARFGHTAVWTGSVMVVWGGYGRYHTNVDPGIRFNTGGRYDPATDGWTPTSTLGAPSAHSGHTAIWTGNVMVVWGGKLPDRVYHGLDTGSRYDPATDTWTPTSTIGAPVARFDHTAVWTGSEMVVWGGVADDGDGLDTGGRYDLGTDRWAPTSMTGAPSAREGHTAVWTGNRMVVWGGYDYPADLDTGGRYDPVTDSWTPTATEGAPAARQQHTAVWTGSRLIVWGGSSDDGSLNSGGRYDPTTDHWAPTSTSNAPAASFGHTAVWTGSIMLIWGGDRGSDAGTGGRYDPATDRWSPMSTTDAPSGRRDHTAVWTGSRMVVWGGDGGGYPEARDSGGVYDPTSDSWSPTSTIGAPSPRIGHTAVWTGSSMLVWGGESLIDVDGLGRYSLGDSVDNDQDGFSGCGGDCDDTLASVHPGATEACNGIDDDCDGVIDDGGNALCDDGNACTTDTCDAATGACSNPIRPNGAVCDDASRCTTGETCQSGACTPAFSRLNRPQPRNSIYYRLLCQSRLRNPRIIQADRLTNADAICVSQLTGTFAAFATVDDVCRVLEGNRRPQQGGFPGADCDQGRSELLAAALNICRAQVCEEQITTSQCRGNTPTTVGQLFTDADTILSDPARDTNTCARATCELIEINHGIPRRRVAPQLAAEPVGMRAVKLKPRR